MNVSSKDILLTSTSVGEILNVHSSTVKRWCDEGVLRSEKTSGGHRRIHLRDALEAARVMEITTSLSPFHPWEANVWLATSEIEDLGSYRRLHNLALGWLARGEADLLGRLLYEVGRRPSIPFPDFLDQGIRGLMAQVGEAWQEGRLVVGEEHMATQVVAEALLRLRPGWDRVGVEGMDGETTRPVAVVGAVEGDQHELGALAVRVILEMEGWRVYYLGADVPVEEFASIQHFQGATLVCISFSRRNHLPDLQRALRVLGEFYREDSPYALALGGALGHISDEGVYQGPFQSLSISRSAQEFLEWVRSLEEDEAYSGLRRGV